MEQKMFPTRGALGQLLAVGTLVGIILLFGKAESYMVGTNPHRRVETLDSQGKFVLEWEVDKIANWITFNVTVETTGYVGFGLSAKGTMSGADIVIGGVRPNGEAYFSDRHAVGNQLPDEDLSQDWELHEARENKTHTFLTFSRALDTCDSQDYPIIEDKVSLIWAYSERDDELGYHYGTRGEFPVHLLKADYTPRIDRDSQNNPIRAHSPYNEDVRIWTWHLPYVMPTVDTTYQCFLEKGPVLPRKQHMIGFHLRFNEEVSRRHVHHVIVTKCKAPPGFTSRNLFEQVVGQSQSCFSSGGRSNSVQQASSGPIRSEYCTDYLLGYAFGSREFFLQPNVGAPIGEDADEYYFFQIHYDNPNMLTGVNIDVYVDVFYTPQLRQNEGDVFVFRHETPGLPGSHLLPPFSLAQTTYAICGSECSRKMLPKEGIRIFGVLLHTHNSGVGMRFRHFRGNRELTPIITEENYSFNYQQLGAVNEVRVLPGDQLVLECTGDNTWSNGTVVGGFSTKQEMCAAWFFYYNRLPNHMICASEINSPEFRESFLGIQNISWSTPDLEYLVNSPSHLAGLRITQVSDMLDWSIERRQELNEFLLTNPYANRCPVEIYARNHTRNENGDPVDLEPGQNLPVSAPLPDEVDSYKVPRTCSSSSGNKNRNNIVTDTYDDYYPYRSRENGVSRGSNVRGFSWRTTEEPRRYYGKSKNLFREAEEPFSLRRIPSGWN